MVRQLDQAKNVSRCPAETNEGGGKIVKKRGALKMLRNGRRKEVEKWNGNANEREEKTGN